MTKEWNEFFASGKVEDYLNCCNHHNLEQSKNSNQVEEEQTKHAEFDNLNRYGDSSPTGGRI